MTEIEQLSKLEEMFGEEELNPELKPYICTEDSGWVTLKHPLVYSVPYTPMLNKHTNLMYEQKVKARDEAWDEGKWMSFVFIHERPYRLDALQEAAPFMDEQAYWELVASVWTDTENCWQNYAIWREVFEACESDARQWLMDDDEQKAFEALPEEITIFRGFTKKGGKTSLQDEDLQLHSFSWTLDRAKAEWFATRFAFEGDTSYVAIAVVSKGDVLAHKLSRGEAEIVVLPDDLRITTLEEL